MGFARKDYTIFFFQVYTCLWNFVSNLVNFKKDLIAINWSPCQNFDFPWNIDQYDFQMKQNLRME